MYLLSILTLKGQIKWGDRLFFGYIATATTHLQELVPTTQPQKCQDSGD